MKSNSNVVININSANNQIKNCQNIDDKPIYYNFNNDGIEFWVYFKTGNSTNRYYEFRLQVTIINWSNLTNNEKSNYGETYAHQFKNLAELIMYGRDKDSDVNYEIINENDIPQKSKIKKIFMKKSEVIRLNNIIKRMEEGRVYDIEKKLIIF